MWGVNEAKWKAAMEYCENKGWNWKIITDVDLTKNGENEAKTKKIDRKNRICQMSVSSKFLIIKPPQLRKNPPSKQSI